MAGCWNTDGTDSDLCPPKNQAFGLSLSSLAFVCAQVERWPSLKLIGLHEAAWAGHQDAVSCQRLRKPYPSRDLPDH